MKLAKEILPDSLKSYLNKDGYNSGAIPTDVSATRLKDSPRISRLYKEHGKKIKVDPLKRGYAKLGEAWHLLMEQNSPPHWVTEKRLYARVGDKVISGSPDALEPVEGGWNIWDYKLMTAYKAQTDMKEFEKQLNIYAFLLRANDMTPKNLYISGVLRDWSDIKVGGDYPDTMFPVFSLPLWLENEAEDYVNERLQLHLSESIPLCTDEDRWMRPAKFAVVSEKTKKTLRLYSTMDEALAHTTKTPVFIQKREAEPIRCTRFCDVAPFCDQYQSEQFTKEVLTDDK